MQSMKIYVVLDGEAAGFRSKITYVFIYSENDIQIIY